ncbi:MAG TPA: GntR family transcriptional regulator [Ideonella sp.]|uniref:GntR family transcriptional regulator n=1 Tax=Ideonella sp. TaxID=1929293 RepID=UPI002CA50205|nr:GntR family transcriptional regulator [Ideonella sp.]HSI47761.1 GntR family transcriptional regulator [Ideonella sp.]
MAISPSEISARIVEAVMAQKLAPGSRLGEQQLALLFDCSRTVVREALTRLAARGIVTVSARRGWYVIEPSQDEAREAFEARRVIEVGLIRSSTGRMDAAALRKLRAHVQREKAALKGDDVGARSFLLGDFHVCLAECLGNSLLADTLRDFTARTTLIAMLYQSQHDAAESCEDHVRIVEALARGDAAEAETLMAAHIGTVQDALRASDDEHDPLAQLRQALAPLQQAPAPAPRRRKAKPAADATPDTPTDDPSPYLGALL